MKYPKVTALVPENENFDESAIINEGGYLSIGHLANIENQLAEQENKMADLEAAADVRIAEHEEAIGKLNNEVATATEAVQAVQTALSTANETIAAQETEITDLKAENDRLKKSPAGQPTATVSEEDKQVVDDGAKPAAHSDPNNSLNKAADNIFKRATKRKIN